MKTYLEFKDSSSHKFWQIEVSDSTTTVRYGKIGTEGQEKVSTFDSPEKATKERDKLVAEKLKKGYVQAAEPSGKKNSKRLSLSYDEAESGKTLLGKIEAFLASEQSGQTDALVIGAWEEPHEISPQKGLDLLVENASKLQKLKELYVGDMDSEECEISWIIQGDYTRIFPAFPQLERLHIKGSNSLTLSSQKLVHQHLKALIIECGGVGKDILATIAGAHLPNLESLTIFLGTEEYGFDGSIQDVRPFLEKGRFPKLRALGLVDSMIADEIAIEAAKASVLEQIETLDLSLGTLSDAGGKALLESAAVIRLKKLDLSHHYLSDAVMKQFKGLGIVVDVSDQQESEDEEDRYVAVGE